VGKVTRGEASKFRGHEDKGAETPRRGKGFGVGTIIVRLILCESVGWKYH
jgi:hypothetical protein